MARVTPAEWAKRVERWQDSGLSAKEFAAELNVNAGTLSYWKYKLRRQGAASEHVPRGGARATESTARFLRVLPVHEAVSADGRFEVVVSGGTVVRIPNDFDEAALIRLVRALGGL